MTFTTTSKFLPVKSDIYNYKQILTSKESDIYHKKFLPVKKVTITTTRNSYHWKRVSCRWSKQSVCLRLPCTFDYWSTVPVFIINWISFQKEVWKKALILFITILNTKILSLSLKKKLMVNMKYTFNWTELLYCYRF